MSLIRLVSVLLPTFTRAEATADSREALADSAAGNCSADLRSTTSSILPVALVGLVVSCPAIASSTWKQVAAWCSHHLVSEIHIVVKHPCHQIHPELQESGCRVHFREQAQMTESLDQLLNNKMDRVSIIRRLRTVQQRELQRALDPAVDAVIVLDFDEAEIPGSGGLHLALCRLRRERWDVLCANGRRRHGGARWATYDSFATVTSDNVWLHTSPIRNGVSIELYNKVVASPVPVPVRSCFGGLSLFRRQLWSGGRCTYLEKPSATFVTNVTLFGEPAGNYNEHLALLECLRATLQSSGGPAEDLRVGIMRELKVTWAGPPKGRRE